MSTLPFATRLGLGTLRARPTLTLLAVLLLSLSTAVVGGLFGTAYLLRALQSEFLSALTVEIELASDSELGRNVVMQRAEDWPSAEFVQYVSPEATLQEMQKETGENLLNLFGTNPFPGMVRVRFGSTDIKTLDSLASAAKSWPEVSDVVYPRRLWSDLNRSASRLQGGLSAAAGIGVLIMLAIVGLCLRAQIRNRAATWEFLRLSGISRGTLRLTLLVQESIIGAISGLVACVLLYALTQTYAWLFFRETAFPFWFYLLVWFSSIVLAIIAGLISPRRFGR